MADDTTARDRLALERTLLANERTLLAYARTALALVGGGAGLVHFFATPGIVALGWTLVGAGVITVGVGGWRFAAVRRRLSGGHPRP